MMMERQPIEFIASPRASPKRYFMVYVPGSAPQQKCHMTFSTAYPRLPQGVDPAVVEVTERAGSDPRTAGERDPSRRPAAAGQKGRAQMMRSGLIPPRRVLAPRRVGLRASPSPRLPWLRS
jgi:hypothetical protein